MKTAVTVFAFAGVLALSTSCGSGKTSNVNSGGCQACDDGDPCTADACDPDTKTCSHGHGVVAAGALHSCLLGGNGEVRCWGLTADGPLGDPTAVSPHRVPPADAIWVGVKALAAGGQTTCAVLNDGGLRCWGSLGNGRTTLLSNVTAVAVGDSHVCALSNDGGVRCWGSNFLGQLGDGTTTDRDTPPDTDVLTGVKAIAAGAFSTCALMNSGGVRCWGSNANGQLGDGTTTDRNTPPTKDVLTGVKAIAAGALHTCAVMNSGGARCWGSNSGGQLGDGSTVDRLTPPTADALTDVDTIAAGAVHTCAVTNQGSVRCWGDNRYGQLGHGSSGAASQTVEVLPGAEAIAAGNFHACALLTNGAVRCWGDDTYGQLGDGVTMPPPILRGVKSVAVTDGYTCAVMTTGGVRCWGDNTGGQLGDGTTAATTAPPTRDILTDVQAMAVGNTTDGVGYPTGGHACALTNSGGVRCWGKNTSGELGDGTTTSRPTPPTIDVLGGVQAIAVGDQHTCALTAAGGLRCWGDNGGGQLGDPNDHFPHPSPPTQDLLSGLTAIATGDDYTCAVTTAGGARCWGHNGLGQLGDGTTVSTNSPPTRDFLTDVQAIAAGYSHACALTNSGGVRCWGDNSVGQLGTGDGGGVNDFGHPPPDHDVLTGVKAISVGVHFTCALTTAGGVRCWGWNSAGQLGDGTTGYRNAPPTEDLLTGVTAISAGGFHACAVSAGGDLHCWPDPSATIVSAVPSTELHLCGGAN